MRNLIRCGGQKAVVKNDSASGLGDRESYHELRSSTQVEEEASERKITSSGWNKSLWCV